MEFASIYLLPPPFHHAKRKLKQTQPVELSKAQQQPGGGGGEDKQGVGV